MQSSLDQPINGYFHRKNYKEGLKMIFSLIILISQFPKHSSGSINYYEIHSSSDEADDDDDDKNVGLGAVTL